MKDGLAAVFVENCEDEIKMQILRKKGQLIFFKKYKIVAFLLGCICEKLEREIALLRMQKIVCRCVAVRLKICSERSS